MSIAVGQDEDADRARRRQAAAAGAFYAANIATILAAIWVLGGIVAPGDPALTAAHVAAGAGRLRLGLGLELVSTACSIVVAGLFYRLFKPVNASFALVAAFFRLTACAVAIFGYVLQFAPLEILARARPLVGLSRDELAAISLVLFRLHGLASSIVILLFGFHFLLIGWLIFRSGFLPRALGLLAIVAGLGATAVLSPWLVARLSPYHLAPGLLTELSLAVSLLVIGLAAPRRCFEEHAAPA